jgi:hypothetical protein
VLARRPAPIQVHYLGYPGTVAGGLVDYLIGDPIVTPREHASDYAEALAVLPDTYQVNDRERPIAEAPPRSELDLPDGQTVFASFSQTYKINPDVFDAWMAILRAVPDAVLWLLAKTGGEPAIANLRREAQGRGVDADRLVFARHRPNPEYLALYRHADLFLDTWPYNAHTTASERAVGGLPGTDGAGRDVRRPRCREPAPRGGTAGAGDRIDAALRREGDSAGGGPRGTRQVARASGGPRPRQCALNTERTTRWKRRMRRWPTSTATASAGLFSSKRAWS